MGLTQRFKTKTKTSDLRFEGQGQNHDFLSSSCHHGRSQSLRWGLLFYRWYANLCKCIANFVH